MLALLLAALAQLPAAEPQYVGVLGLTYAPSRGEAGRLDLYAPGTARNAPIVVYVRGGATPPGDRKASGFLGRALARQGAVCVIPSVRTEPPGARGPAQDVAAAVAWTAAHAREYGGDPRRIVLVGEDAGAAIAASVAFDPSYLAVYGLTPGALHGVFSIVRGSPAELVDPDDGLDRELFDLL